MNYFKLRSKKFNLIFQDLPLVLRGIRKEFEKSKSWNVKLNGIFRPKIKRQMSNILPLVNDNKVVLRNLSIGFRNREVFGLLGPNGAGKTTAMK